MSSIQSGTPSRPLKKLRTRSKARDKPSGPIIRNACGDFFAHRVPRNRPASRGVQVGMRSPDWKRLGAALAVVSVALAVTACAAGERSSARGRRRLPRAHPSSADAAARGVRAGRDAQAARGGGRRRHPGVLRGAAGRSPPGRAAEPARRRAQDPDERPRISLGGPPDRLLGDTGQPAGGARLGAGAPAVPVHARRRRLRPARLGPRLPAGPRRRPDHQGANRRGGDLRSRTGRYPGGRVGGVAAAPVGWQLDPALRRGRSPSPSSTTGNPRPTGQSLPAPVTITDPATVRELAALIDGLPLSTIPPDAPCPSAPAPSSA